jgi:hypothetical protein
MPEPAYIALNDDQQWTLFYGDGSEDELYPLALGRPFEPGAAIREAVDELSTWAAENGFEIVTPLHAPQDIPLRDLIEPEVFDEVFGGDEDVD